jgi:hypothetical protein
MNQPHTGQYGIIADENDPTYKELKKQVLKEIQGSLQTLKQKAKEKQKEIISKNQPKIKAFDDINLKSL